MTFLRQLKHKELHILAPLCRRGERSANTRVLQKRQRQIQASFVSQWEAYGKQILSRSRRPTEGWGDPQRCAQTTGSTHDGTLGCFLIALKWLGHLAVRQLVSAPPQVEGPVLSWRVGRPCVAPKACQRQTCHISWSPPPSLSLNVKVCCLLYRATSCFSK